MAVKPIDIHPEALAELKSATSWYLAQSESAASKFVAELDRAIDLVAASPSRWPGGDDATRRFILRRFPFAIIYRERGVSVQVLAVAHGHRQPGYWKVRL